MNLSNQHKCSLSLALAVCLCAPVAAYAANYGGTTDGSGNYVGTNPSGSNNNVNVDESTPNGGVYGGWKPSANNNKVTVSGNANVTSVFGGFATNNANNNEVTITGGTVTGSIYGGQGAYGTANNNIVKISNVIIKDYINGGYSGASNADHNIVELVNVNTAKNIYGGESNSGTADNNKVTITSGTITNNIYGGSIVSGTSANNNYVTLNSATISGLIFGGFAQGITSTANGNTVTLNNVTVTVNNDITGGSGVKEASNNTVIINGGTINRHVYGGKSSGEASNNTVILTGDITFGNVSWIRGGQATTSINNTLKVYTTGLTCANIANFQNWELAMGNTDEVTISTPSTSVSLSDLKISAPVVLPHAQLNVGDQVTLFSAGTIGIDDTVELQQDGIAKQGILYKYGYNIEQVGNEIFADITSKEKNSQATSVADGQLAAMGMLRSGADLVASAAMDNAAKANTEYDAFAAMNYSKMSMDSVSSVDVQGSSMLVGMGRNIQHTGSNLTIGAFLEAGWGTYESSTGLAHAKGHTNYYGVGVLARNNANSGIYTEGSLRVGKVGNTYSGNTEADGTYDVSSTYYGLHLGIGKINQINETTSTDIYAKYFYAHEGSTDANIAGDKFSFESIDSHRVRIGGRLNSLNKNINRYVGLAYEYEFSGKAQATAYGVDIATPTAKGSSGILELGLVYKPTTDSKFSMDMGMNGYVGKRKGVTGNVTLNWGF